jgi:hypothetical protein
MKHLYIAALLIMVATSSHAQNSQSHWWTGTASTLDSGTGQGAFITQYDDFGVAGLVTWEMYDDGANPAFYLFAPFELRGIANTEACLITAVSEFTDGGQPNDSGAIAEPTVCYPAAVLLEREVCASPEPPEGCPVIGVQLSIGNGDQPAYRFTQRF